MTQPGTSQLLLSVFPGVGLLDRGFEHLGFNVVRGPDPLWGGDVRKFNAPSGHFVGVIGGPPCQKFSLANRQRDVEAGMELVNEFLRIVAQAAPSWALMENVAGSPAVTAPGFVTQRFTLNATHCGSEQHRLRVFHYFHRPGTAELVLSRDFAAGASQRTCMASEGRRTNRRDWSAFCALQGLPPGYDLPGFTMEEKYRAVGNGVPFVMACELATAIRRANAGGVTPHRLCICRCGQVVTGRAETATAACRKRLQRDRDRAGASTAASQTNLWGEN